MPDMLAKIEHDMGRHLSAEELEGYYDREKKVRMADDEWLRAMTAADKDPIWAMSVIRNRGIGAAVIKNPSESFVIGDMPLLKTPSLV